MSQVRVHNFSVSLDGFGTGRNAARERLAALLRDAVVPPLARRATRPTRSSQRRRLDDKKRRSETKDARRRPGAAD